MRLSTVLFTMMSVFFALIVLAAESTLLQTPLPWQDYALGAAVFVVVGLLGTSANFFTTVFQLAGAVLSGEVALFCWHLIGSYRAASYVTLVCVFQLSLIACLLLTYASIVKLSGRSVLWEVLVWEAPD